MEALPGCIELGRRLVIVRDDCVFSGRWHRQYYQGNLVEWGEGDLHVAWNPEVGGHSYVTLIRWEGPVLVERWVGAGRKRWWEGPVRG